MKKAGVFIGIFLLVFSFSVLAQEDATKIDKAYSCAIEKAKGKCKDITLEEKVFSLLGLSSDSAVLDECKKALLDTSEDNKCWPKGSCKVKDTALAVLALKHVGTDVAQGVNWLLSKNSTPRDLTWYLQIDAREETACKISYGGKDFTTVIKADKTLTQGAGSCLTRAQNNYWLQIASGCLSTTFTVSCDKGFISNLIYKKSGSNVFYISSDTKSAPASGSTENAVVATCFGNPCDYEGSLLATLALSKAGKDISPYLPFLNALATDNEKYLPAAFLHILTGDEEHFSKLTSLHAAGAWDVRSGYGKFYDTALALLALQSTSSEQADAAKQWLLQVQPTNGCWQNSLRDTSFILYAAWPKAPSRGGGTTPVDYCKDFNYFCITPGDCAETGGEQLNNYFCPSLSAICCSKPAVEKNCLEKNGRVCADDEECTGSTISASDSGRCCDSSCVKKQTQPECEIKGYFCQSSCSDNQEEASYGCTGSNTCCKTKEVPPVPPRSYWWIWVLVILIILVILGIVFRNRLSLWLFRRKGGKGKEAPSSPGGRFPPTAPFPARLPQARPPFGRPGVALRGPAPRIPARLRPSDETDKELDETLRKLKDMGK